MPRKTCIVYVLALMAALLINSIVLAHPLKDNIQDRESLQRGAKLFMNYCSGCHSLKYLRYNQMAKGLGLTQFDGRINEDLLKNNLIFTQATINDPIRIALPPKMQNNGLELCPRIYLSLLGKKELNGFTVT